MDIIILDANVATTNRLWNVTWVFQIHWIYEWASYNVLNKLLSLNIEYSFVISQRNDFYSNSETIF